MLRNNRQILNLTLFGLILMMMACWGCNQEEITNVYITEEPPSFTVSGRVTSLPDITPIAGASYTVMPGNISGTCDENGYLELTNIPPGDSRIMISAPGHSTSIVELNLSVPYGKANYNEYRNFYLMENTCSMNLTVFSQATGETMTDVPVYVYSVEHLIQGHSIDRESIHVSGVTDENGQVTLTGLPVSRVYFSIDAHDIDGDGEYDYGAMTSSFVLTADETTPGHMVLPPYTGNFPEIIVNNLPTSYGESLSAPSLFFIFSVPMDTELNATNTTLYQDNSPYQEIPVNAVWSSPIRLVVTPNESLANPMMDYNFNVTVRSEDGQSLTRSWPHFYWLSDGVSSDGDCEEFVNDLLAVNPLGEEVDFDTRTFQLSWSAVSCAGGYRIYARDDRNNTQWLFLGENPTDFETGTVTETVTLPSSFDRYNVDSIQTPFAGTEVSFCVVPLDAADSTPGGSHGMVVVRDERVPTIMGVIQHGTSNNDTGITQSIQFNVYFSEYISPSVEDPVIEIAEMGGDDAFALDPATATWVWNAGRMSGQFVFEIADGVNASGDEYRVVITDLADLSGNSNTWFTSTEWATVEVFGAFFDFEGSAQGWSQSGEGWEWGIPTIGPGEGHESQYCWGVSLDSNYGDNWDTSLTSPIFIVPTSGALLTYWAWISTDYYDDILKVYLDTGDGVVLLEQLSSSTNNWVEYSHSLASFAGQSVSLIFQFTSDSYGNYPGFYIDDVVVGSPYY